MGLVNPEAYELIDGHWYSTATPIPGAHCTPDGRPVGIYCAGKRALTPTADDAGNLVMARGAYVPGHIVIQAPDGHDLIHVDVSDPHQIKAYPVRVLVEHLQDLRRLEEADHLPESRRAHLPEGMKLFEASPADTPRLVVPFVRFPVED
jgi:hypothetical protein